MSYYPINIEQALIKECTRRRYSERTIKTYLYCINRFLKFTGKTIDKISKKDVRLFLEHLSEKNRAGNTMNVYHMAIRFLFEDILNKRIWIDIKYSKVPEKLPIFLSKEEIKKLFGSIENSKHKIMIQLMYGAGLRVSELINLKKEDLELDNGYGFVRHGKGNKDRLFLIAENLKEDIKNLMMGTQDSEYLFTSIQNKKYNIRTLQQIIKNATKKAGITKKVSCHTLRHSFATHLVENGNSISEIQALLGHKSPETTFIYLHSSGKMVNTKSPFDSL